VIRKRATEINPRSLIGEAASGDTGDSRRMHFSATAVVE
jgi:hypothetical protein